MKFEDILEISPYSLNKEQKNALLTERCLELTEYHKNSCPEYARMLKSVSFDIDKAKSYLDLPFLPVRLFKEFDLKSVPDEEIVKTMTSSGTTGQKTSKIYLDRATSSNQQKTMVKIVSDFTGSARMPMIIIDSPSVLKDRKMFSARGAGILGFSIFGSKKIYALDDEMNLNIDALKDFISQNQGQKILMFGFTFMVWQYFYKELLELKKQGVEFDLSNAVLIHGGGWKKLQSEAVSPDEFKARLNNVCGIERVHDYYGMVEQTGCIYMQCECGHLHTSIFSDVIAHRPSDFSICDYGEKGILQVVSTIPESYPGHSLLTEDEGIILGEDDCPCGRKGRYFSVIGRIAKAEIRGCSDTFAQDHSPVSDRNILNPADSVLDKVTFLVGSRDNIRAAASLKPLKPFDETIVEFLSALSKELMTDRRAVAFPDVVTLGFWLRKASVLKLKDRFDGSGFNIGRGLAFHIAPSNVAVNYAYSMFTALMCGNANIVRAPSKDFPQIGIINSSINKVLDDERFIALRPYTSVVRYERDKEINDYFSSLCDERIIWGGDKTIEELRLSPIKARAKEITFSDRYSLAIIDSDTYLELNDKKKFASDFYNDTYLTDQNACTSPRLVVWTGRDIDIAKRQFWKELTMFTEQKYTIQAIQSVDKLSLLYSVSVSCDGIVRNDFESNILYRVSVDSPSSDLMDFRGNSGYFYEYDCKNILELRDFCNDARCQTIGILGESSIVKPLVESGLKGVDRIVPIGHTMDFDLIWDGYNLFSELTRTIKV